MTCPARTARGTLRRLAVICAAAVLAGCGSGAGSDAVSDDAAVAAGQEAFETYCVTCHGAGAQGTDKGPPLVHILYEPSHHSDEAFRSAAREGVVPHHWDFGPMPPVDGISDPELDAVVGYVRGLQREAGIE